MTDSCHIWFVILLLEVKVMKYTWRKQEKEFYLPTNKPSLVNIPKAKFLCIKGKGNPNHEDFSCRVKALYKLSYTIKMLPKNNIVPKGYYDYTVYPLEGLWYLSDKGKQETNLNKDELIYTLMIKQPDFVNDEVLNEAIEIANKKTTNLLLSEVYLEEIEDGLSVQMLHIGSYDDEPNTFHQMKVFINENHLKIKTSVHREIYLSDARRVEEEKRKTVLRYLISNVDEEDRNHE